MSFQAPGKFAHSQSRQAREITQHSPYRTYCCSARHALPCGASKFHVSVTQTTPVHHGTLEALSSFNDCLHTRRSLQLNLRSPSAMHGMMGGGTTLCTTELDSRQPKLKRRAPAPPGSPTVHNVGTLLLWGPFSTHTLPSRPPGRPQGELLLLASSTCQNSHPQAGRD